MSFKPGEAPHRAARAAGLIAILIAFAAATACGPNAGDGQSAETAGPSVAEPAVQTTPEPPTEIDRVAQAEGKVILGQRNYRLFDDSRPGRWSRPEPKPEPGPDPPAAIHKLETLGYLAGSTKAPSRSGVTRHDPNRAWAGLNLYLSAHSAEAILTDMDGHDLHRWSVRIEEVWPERAGQELGPGANFWGRAHLYPNGDLLAMFNGLGLVKLDRHSNILWANFCKAHHDLEVAENGDIYALTHDATIMERFSKTELVLEDFISVFDAEGREKKRVSVFAALEASQWKSISQERGNLTGDIYHTNTIFILDGALADRVPAFARGRVLTSMFFLNTIAVVDLETEQVVWAARGDFRHQHDPRILDSGSLLLFDNAGSGDGSRVLEFDPATMDVVWKFEGTEADPFYSAFCGTSRRLPNGNTLITESDAGRAFEVTRGGEIVWEFLNPHRAGDDLELIATLFDLIRLDKSAGDWIEKEMR